jgi:mannose-6-phosphate isomerase-like protein (cupin superfamily)
MKINKSYSDFVEGLNGRSLFESITDEEYKKFGTIKYVKKDPDGLGMFRDIAKKVKTVEEFISKTREIKDVPTKISTNFLKKYGENNTLSMEDTAKNFLDAVKTEIVKESVNEEESNFTSEQKTKIKNFIEKYKGDFEDDDIHKLSDELKLDNHEVEEYIYSISRSHLREGENKKSDKKGYHVNIEKATTDNNNFRKVLYTGEHTQLVLMSLKPDEEIGLETHPDIDQFFRVDAGNGKCIINGNEYNLKNGDCVIVPAGSEHNIINTGKEPLKLYTLYSPPHHKDGIIFKTKKDAEASKEKFDGKPTE